MAKGIIKEVKKNALRSLVHARNELLLAGFETDLSETIDLDKGKLVVHLKISEMELAEASFLIKEQFGVPLEGLAK